MTPWINCEIGLPSEKEDIIMTYNDLVLCGWYEDGRFYYFDQYGNGEEQEGITHWMPLPKPPGEE